MVTILSKALKLPAQSLSLRDLKYNDSLLYKFTASTGNLIVKHPFNTL